MDLNGDDKGGVCLNAKDDWMSFWKPGVEESGLLALLEAANSAEKTHAALREFADSHRDFPISPSDSGPLAYGQNVFGAIPERLTEAIDKLVESGIDDAMPLALLAKLQRLVGDYTVATDFAHRAIDVDDRCAEAFFQMALLSRIASNPDAAMENFDRAVGLAPDRVDYQFARAEMLQFIVRDRDAIEAFLSVIELNPDHAPAYHSLCWSYRRLGRMDEAIAAGRRAVEIDPNVHTFFHLTFALLSAGLNTEALDVCHESLRHNPMDARALAFLPSVLEALGRGEEGRRISDIKNLVRSCDIAPPPGFASVPEFNRAIAAMVLDQPGRILDDTQTNDLFRSSTGPFAAFRDVINKVVESYYSVMPENASHPFLSHRTTNWRIDGWGTRLKSYDEHEPHFHRHGWLSGVYYVKIPPQVSERESRDGWIEFVPAPTYTGANQLVDTMIMRPEEGMMIIFPSFLYHRVLPFDENDYRISIAFNLTPE